MSLHGRIRTTVAAALVALGATAALLTGALSAVPPAGASTNQMAMFEDSAQLLANPGRTLQILRSLGVGIVRVPLIWNQIAPNPNSRTGPAGFDATNPSAYPAAKWGPYDAIVNDARADGIAIDFLVTGGAPLWATTPGAPSGFASVWKPSAGSYGAFVQAAATRYSSVHFWELWNEGNWGPALAPQVTSHSSQIVSAGEYRSLLDNGWSALQRTAGHAQDTIVAGSLSPDGSEKLTATDISPPLLFLQTLYCVDSSYYQLRGSAAQAVGCPTTSAGSGKFSANNPALFKASGIGVHPYGYGNPPTGAAFPNPDSVEFSEIPQFTRGLDRIQRVYGSHRHLAIYNTEFGYETRPPQTSRQFPTPTTAAQYINWAEYLSWKNPRLATTNQYLLFDGNGWFTTGLIFPSKRLKPSFYAYRMPVWMPVTATKRGRTLEVWGCVRPAHFANIDTNGHAQAVDIQFARGSSGKFTTIKAVSVTSARGYFDVRIKFPASGQVRLAWEYPVGDQKLADPLLPGKSWIYSRVTSITLQ